MAMRRSDAPYRERAAARSGKLPAEDPADAGRIPAIVPVRAFPELQSAALLQWR